MDLYTLTNAFVKKNVIDEFTSVIWTERYSSAGEVELVVPATSKMITLLQPGQFLSLEGSKEVMLLETQKINEDGLMTVSGNTLLAFLNNRMVRYSPYHHHRQWTVFDGSSPGEALAQIVLLMVMGPPELPGVAQSNFPNLTLGAIDTTIEGSVELVPHGQAYDALREIAQAYQVGISLYLESATLAGYSLKFTAYNGRDLTSDQDIFSVVRFSPANDSLRKVQELHSISGFKNIAYAYAPSYSDSLLMWPGGAATGVEAIESSGFDRRVLQVQADDITFDDASGSEAVLLAMLNQRAKDALANNNYTKIVDGEVVPQSDYKYGTHYKLGDIVELQGHSNITSKARITEYIRSQDETGERAYPTVSIVD